MVFIVQCPSCQRYNLVEEEMRGEVVNCLACSAKFQLEGKPAESTSDSSSTGS